MKIAHAERERIERIHREGAEQHRALWLRANLTAVDLLTIGGLRPDEHQLLGALIALRLCQWAGKEPQ